MRATHGNLVRTAAALTLLLCCAVPLGGCVRIPVGGGNGIRELLMPEGADSTRSVPATATPATDTISPAMIGTSQSAGSWKVVVLGARTSAKGPGGKKAAKGKEFLLLDTQFRNMQMQQTLVVYPKDVTLRSASGKKIAMSGTRPGYNTMGMREIGPGYGGFTVFSYQIPKGSSGYVFTFAPKERGERAKMQWGVP
jgi:hypothetical protein